VFDSNDKGEGTELRKLVSQGMVMFAGLLVAPLPITPVLSHNAALENSDPRLPVLKQFLLENGAPIAKHAQDFLLAADTYELDWRLLPSISVIESSGGKYFKNNNILGWANCEHRFPSIRAGIFTVADRLANSKLYRSKGLEQILRTYNSNADYPGRVKRVMRRIGPAAIPASFTN
jgi:hypothetical protein